MRISVAFAAAAVLATLCASASDVLLYLQPAAHSSDATLPVAISAPEFDRVLVKHLHVPAEAAGGASVAADEKRTIVMLTGMDGIELSDVMPASVRNTHTITDVDGEVPHASSFEALFHSYGQRLYDATGPAGLAGQFTGFFSSAIEGMEEILEGALGQLLGSDLGAVAQGKKTLDQTDLADKISQPFYKSMHNLVAYLDTLGGKSDTEQAQKSVLQALRFDGLGEIKSAYGEESRQYRQAKEMLRNVLQAAADKIDWLQQHKQPHSLAFVVVPHTAASLEKRSDPLRPFRATLRNTPFLSTRDVEEDIEVRQEPFRGGSSSSSSSSSSASSSSTSSSSGKSTSTSTPKPSEYEGKCFKSAKDLNKATNDCSGRGKARESHKGGRQCFRCQCQKSTDGGRVTEWAGDACERVAFGKPYVLLAVTTIALLLVTLLSVMHLFYEGSQELPSVLAGITIPNKLQ